MYMTFVEIFILLKVIVYMNMYIYGLGFASFCAIGITQKQFFEYISPHSFAGKLYVESRRYETWSRLHYDSDRRGR